MKSKSFFLFLPIAVFATAARAGCGLEYCQEPTLSETSSSLGVTYQNVRYDWQEFSGTYSAFLSRYQYTARRWKAGGFVSVITLHGEDHTGIGNPVAFAEYRLTGEGSSRAAVGAQVELDAGDHEHGIASEHSEALPYLSVSGGNSYRGWAAVVGTRYALTESHSHGRAPGHTPQVVNPHEGKELLYRASLRSAIGWTRWQGEIFGDGQHALTGEGRGPGYLTGGLSPASARQARGRLELLAEFPLTSPRRIERRLGIGAAVVF
jgi:hypothetical protein